MFFKVSIQVRYSVLQCACLNNYVTGRFNPNKSLLKSDTCRILEQVNYFMLNGAVCVLLLLISIWEKNFLCLKVNNVARCLVCHDSLIFVMNSNLKRHDTTPCVMQRNTNLTA